jgi:iron(III) transport system ATP-binding protein
LARALVIEPGVLLFDEPLSNLDAKLRVSMRTEIRRIQQEAGITAVYVTHDQSEAMAISDKVIIMNGGIVEQVASPQEAYYYPKSKFVADFIGECNFLKGKVISQDQVEIDGVKVNCVTGKLQQGADCDVVLRPEGATLADAGDVKGIVKYSCFMGAYQDYHIQVGDSLVKIQEYNPKNKKIYMVGDTVFLHFEDNTLYAL